MAWTDPPTQRQQQMLRTLATQRGQSFTPPKTRREASDEIDRLKKTGRSSRIEQHLDRDVVSAGLSTFGDGARHQTDDVTGFGSSATWANRRSGV